MAKLTDGLLGLIAPKATAAACTCDWSYCFCDGEYAHYQQLCTGTTTSCGYGCKALDYC